MSILLAALALLPACGIRIDPTGDRCPGDGTLLLWDEVMLSRKAAEDGPSARWYYCERDLDGVQTVDEALGWAGPIENISSGATRGEAKWVRVLADDVALISLWARNERALPEKVGGVDARRELLWRWSAQAKASYTDASTDKVVTLSEAQARAYIGERTGAGGLPVDWSEDYVPPPGASKPRSALAAACVTVAELRNQMANYPGCRAPSPGKSEPQKPAGAPPGAEPPDKGGIEVPPGTTPGGSGDEGDK
ncbi:hypothetical protein [Sorangium sp. So ce388]|uniref:hypothetical protein n=1 Tax=Sorangium sp. So ce388 TaxID=3133309 RepID=UPI003F5B5C08